ncbi:Cyclin-D3-2 [Glycine soja]|uniref:Cyclin-D3-2 n=1 Tax=Glycine soja TaxID=3848 RepID=A0A0B2P7W9_GLYSO|nr:hypothetical protein JHK87_015858 [Glycine soja]KHN03684.1 Cyclin-D3-2 [Glycine soja]
MALGDDAQHHSPSFLDALLCEERETFEEDFDENGYERETENNEPSVIKLQSLPLVLHDNDLFWEGEELVSLTAKEGEIHLCFHGVVANGALEGPRVEAVNWISKVCGHYGVVAESNMDITFQGLWDWVRDFKIIGFRGCGWWRRGGRGG